MELPLAGQKKSEKPRKGTEYPKRITTICGTPDLRISLVECTTPENRGSMGAIYVENAIRSAGHQVQFIDADNYAQSGPWDVELVSVHHCTDFPRLKNLPRRGRIRIVGGHPSTNNIRPAIPFGDVFCIGEGEEWIIHVLDRIAAGASAIDLSDLPGTIIREIWNVGQPIPETNTIVPLPKHPPYLNRAGDGHAPTWYIEMARGCPFSCHYCELGWAWKYRPQSTEYLLSAIDSIDKSRSKKVSLFAPDEASHPGYAECLQRIHDKGLITSFGSMRLDVIVKQGLPIKPNMLIRVGLDGLTESTRIRVHKPIKNQDVVNYFRFMSDRGHSNFKVFMVFGYPWESPSDFKEFESVFEQIRRIPRRVNAHVRVKFTPFIPQPSTPLGDSKPNYDHETVGLILDWFQRVKSPRSQPGWYFANDGIMSKKSHDLQCQLTLGDERLLVEKQQDWSHCETLKGYDA